MFANFLKPALVLGLLPLISSDASAASPALDAMGQALDQDYSPVIRAFVLLSLLSFLPVMLIGVTAFTRIIIVLALLRHALGIPQTPPNSVLVTLAVFLSLFAMAPVLNEINHLIPAFLLSELKTAFQIGFVIFLPFLLIDLVVAASLMSLGMIMVPPTTVSLPLKILLFILIDGWVLIAQSLLSSYMV